MTLGKSRFEFEYQTSYPPVLVDKKTGQTCVIVSQTEVFLTRMLIELDEKLNLLEERLNCLNKKVFKEASQPPKSCYNEEDADGR